MTDVSHMHAEALLAQSGWVRALARRLVEDRSLAEDVAQETFLAAIQRPPAQARNVRSLRAWLARVVRNRVHLSAREETHRKQRERMAARPEALDSTAKIVERAAQHRMLADLVMKLAEPYRSTILLRYLEGLSPREIAATQGVSNETVRKRISRGVAKLRAELERTSEARDGWHAALAGLAVPARTASLLELSGGLAVAKSSSTFGLLAIGLALAGVSLVAWVKLSDDRSPEPALASARSQAPQAVESAPPARVESAADQTRLEVDDPSPAHSAAVGEVPIEPEALEVDLESVAATFLTDEPDLLELRELLEQLSGSAEVVAESIERNESTGIVGGKIRFGETGIEATFKIDGDDYGVNLSSWIEVADQPFKVRDLALEFRQESGQPTQGTTAVQFHPDSHASPSKFLGQGAEEYVGWVISVGSQHSTARPMTMRSGPEGRGWIIGNPEADSFSTLDAGWAWHPGDYQPWAALLRPFAQ